MFIHMLFLLPITRRSKHSPTASAVTLCTGTSLPNLTAWPHQAAHIAPPYFLPAAFSLATVDRVRYPPPPVLLVLPAPEAFPAALLEEVFVGDPVSAFAYDFPFNGPGVGDDSLLVAPSDEELVLTRRASHSCGLSALIDILWNIFVSPSS